MAPPRFVLWDIDGTLVRAGDVGAVIFDRALEAVLGTPPIERVRMSGKTDPQIVREYLDMMGITDPNALAIVLERAEIELAAAIGLLAEQGNACPGAHEMLAAAAATPNLTQSVLTGNLRANAHVKLAAFDLDHYVDLEIGAYGSDNPDRNCLVPIALERAASYRGLTFERDQVWIIGDTPNDLACAVAGGARCLLVATGRFTFDELVGLGAEATLPDLTDTDLVLELISAPAAN